MADNNEKKFDKYQQAAITVKENAVVSAGAGSGKTTVLSQRFLHLVRERNLDVDQILTLTFTKKATVEMSDRIYKVLKKEEPAKAADFYKANIKTFDSFCNSVAKLGARMYGITPDFAQDNSTVYELASQKALPFILEHRDNALLKLLVDTKNYQEIANQLFVMPVLENSTIAEPVDFDKIFEMQKAELVKAWNENGKITNEVISGLTGLVSDFPEGAGGTMLAALREKLILQEIPEFANVNNDNIFGQGLAAAIEFILAAQNVAVTRPTNARNTEEIKDMIYNLRTKVEVLISIVNCINGFKLVQDSDFLSLMKEFQDIVNNIKRSNGILTFADVSSIALCTLRDYPDLRKLEKERYKAIMVDEFQDNNSMQRDILFLLAERPERMEKGIPSPEELCTDKLFFVGDEKQSIYFFRGADVSVFRHLSQDFADGNLSMSTNYRSHPALIGAFNTIFGGINFMRNAALAKNASALSNSNPSEVPSVFFKETDGKKYDIPEYEAVYHEVTLPESKSYNEVHGNHVHFALYDSTQEVPQGYLSGEEAEAEWVAQKISSLIENGTSPDDIAVLMRATPLQPLYERAFLSHGIPYSTEAVIGFFSDGPANDLYALIKLCAYPQDTAAYFQLLTSPFVNLSVDEAGSVIKCEDKTPFAPQNASVLSEDAARRYEQAGKFYEELSITSRYEPICKTVTKIWYETGYRFETMWNQSVEMYSKLYDIIFELARQADAGNQSIAAFADSLTACKANTGKAIDDMDIPMEQRPGVHIMTIHKSKGLEFDTVFVCGTHKGTPNEKRTQPVYTSRKYGIVIHTPPVREFADKDINFFFDKAKEEKDRKLSAELRRLVYVALTRAKTNLYITSGRYTPAKDSSVFLPTSDSGTIVDTIFNILEPVFDFYQKDENRAYSFFDVETIEPLPRFASFENAKRRNNAGIKAELIKKIDESKVYEKAELLEKEIPDSKYVSPSHLHDEDNELQENELKNNLPHKTGLEELHADEPHIDDLRASKDAPYPEINDIVISTIPAEFKKADIARPLFGFNDFGTIAHAYLEGAVMNREPVIPNKALSGLTAKQSDASASGKIDVIKSICSKMAKEFLSSELGKAAAASDFKKAEYSFRSRVGSKIVRGSIDLVFRNSDGTYTIVDYKSNQEMKPEIYFEQLACYRSAIAAMLGVPADSIKCFLYYLRFAKEVDITKDVSSINLENHLL